MKKNKKLLTIITVVKNDELNIEKTIKSIVSQKNSEVEYIIIDGNSRDKTTKLVKKYKNKIDKILVKKDRGIYDAMNKGILNSSGKYVGFCNSGDIIRDHSLKIILKFLKQNIDVLFATVKRNYLGGYIIKSGFNLKRLLYNFDFATSHTTGFYVKKSIHKMIGLYDIKFKCSSDYDFYLRLFKNKNILIKSTPKNKIIGEVKSGGFSSTFTPLQHLNEETKIRIKNNQNYILICIIYLNTLFKICLKKLNDIFK